MIVVLLITFFFFLFFGMPIGFSMIIASLLALCYEGVPLTIIPETMFAGVNQFTLLAIPLFVLAGRIMEKGRISEHIVEFANSLVGQFRGGLGMVAVMSSMVFAGMSGSASADATATGSITIPAMMKSGYKPGLAASIEASASALGPILPPSIMMIIYGSLTEVSIGKMFLGGVFPGIGVGLGIIAMIFYVSSTPGHENMLPTGKGIVLKETMATLLRAVPDLILPFLIIGGIVFGAFTPTEAGIIAVVYSLFLTLAVYRSLNFSDLKGILLDSLVTTCNVCIILAAAHTFAWILIRENTNILLRDFLLSITATPTVLLILICLALLIIGCFIEALAAAIILIPVLDSIGVAFGFNEVHFAVLIITTLMVGSITPPVGLLLFITTSIAKASIESTFRYVFLVVLPWLFFICLMVFFPKLVTFLPDYFFK